MPDEVCVSFYLEVSPGIPGSTPEHRFQVADRGRSTRSARIGETRARRGKAGLATRPGRTAATIQVRYSHRHEMFPVQDSGRQALDAGMGKREAIKHGESHGIP